MPCGNAVQEGVRIKLLMGMTWEKLASIGPEDIREKDPFPPGSSHSCSRTTRKAVCFAAYLPELCSDGA